MYSKKKLVNTHKGTEKQLALKWQWRYELNNKAPEQINKNIYAWMTGF